MHLKKAEELKFNIKTQNKQPKAYEIFDYTFKDVNCKQPTEFTWQKKSTKSELQELNFFKITILQ
jgi:hypothetical protein